MVVVRYFGGTKLGVGGLINAYKSAAEDALRKLKRKEIFEVISIEMKFPYDVLSNVERLISDFDIEVNERDFQLSCKVVGEMKKDLKGDLLSSAVDLYTLEIDLGD